MPKTKLKTTIFGFIKQIIKIIKKRNSGLINESIFEAQERISREIRF